MRRTLVAALIAATIFGTGCGGNDAEPARAQVIESTENKLPRGFPPNFPLPGDFKVVFGRAEATAVSAFFRTQLTAPQIKALMLKELPAKGWTLVNCSTVRTAQGDLEEIVASNSGVLGTIGIGAGAQVSEKVREAYSFAVTLVRVGAAPPTGPGCS